jgi:sulfate transport system substrate-binding protein
MNLKKLAFSAVILSLAFTAVGCGSSNTGSKSTAKELLNVSYDPTRELYEDFNKSFVTYYEKKTGTAVKINQSHGGSGSQARKVVDGLNADVVTLALEGDVNAVQDAGLIDKGWVKEFPNNSAPYTSTIVFLVRKNNPKKIADWSDLATSGVKVITPNPKTSGGARWNFLAAWAYGLKQNNNAEAKAQAFVQKIYKNVAVLDTGARASTTTFVERGIGDVLITWENEALLTIKDLPADKRKNFKIVYPSMSILAEPSVAVVDKNVDKNGTRKIAEAYLDYLYTKGAQEIIAKNYYRPRNTKILNTYLANGTFKKLDLVQISDAAFGGWAKAQEKFFNDGGVFDKIYN